jgi:predicted RNA methylase
MRQLDDITQGYGRARTESRHESLDSLERALVPDDPNPSSSLHLNRIYRRLVPRWHFAMLNDGERNQAFHRALQAQLTPGQLVLDIGAGSGLLAMMAVRSGARAAISCEMLEPIAHLARRIAEANGVAHRISIVPKASFDLTVGEELPERADLLVTETVDCGLLGEGILPIIRHAREHLLHEHSKLIPARASLSCSLLRSSAIHGNNFVSEAEGFDVSLFNHFSTREYFPVRLSTWPHTLMSEPVKLFDFDFLRDSLEPRSTRVRFEARESGPVHGVVFWFELDLGAGIRLTNAPDNTRGHWMQAVHCFEVPVHVERGQVLGLDVHHDDTSLRFAPLEIES